MNRKNFIKTFLNFIGLLITPRIITGNNNPRKTCLLSDYVAGYQYHKGENVKHEFAKHGKLKLRLEENNPYDKNAIEIYRKDIKIGYIARSENQVIANLIRNKKNIYAEIEKYTPNNPAWKKLYIKIFMLEG